MKNELPKKYLFYSMFSMIKEQEITLCSYWRDHYSQARDQIKKCTSQSKNDYLLLHLQIEFLLSLLKNENKI